MWIITHCALHIVQGQDSSLLSICSCSQVRLILWEWIFLWQQQNLKIILCLWYQLRGVRNHHHHDEQDLSMDEHEYEYEAWVWMAAIPRCLPPRTVTSFPFCPNLGTWAQHLSPNKFESNIWPGQLPSFSFISVLPCMYDWVSEVKTPRSHESNQ